MPLVSLSPWRLAHAEDKLIKIGALLPMSGRMYFGAQDKQGTSLRSADPRQGVNGYKLPSIRDRLQPAAGDASRQRLLEQYKPDVVIGEECSDATLAMMSDGAAKVPLMNAGSSSIKITEPGILDISHYAERGYAGRRYRDQRLQAAQCPHRVCSLREHQCWHRQREGVQRYVHEAGGKILADIGLGATSTIPRSRPNRRARRSRRDPTYARGQGLKITQALARRATRGGGGKAIQLGTIWLPFGFEQKAGRRRSATCGSSVRSDRARPAVATSSPPSRRNTTRTLRTFTPTPTIRSSDRRRHQARRHRRPVDPRRSRGDQERRRRHRQRRVRQDQPEHQDGHDPLHGDAARPVMEGAEVELSGR